MTDPSVPTKEGLWAQLDNLLQFLSDIVENEHVFLDAIEDVFDAMRYLVLKDQPRDLAFRKDLNSTAKILRRRKPLIWKVYRRFWQRITTNEIKMLISIPPHDDVVTIRYHTAWEFNQKLLNPVAMRLARRNAMKTIITTVFKP